MARYAIAVSLTCLIAAGGAAFCTSVRRTVDRQIDKAQSNDPVDDVRSAEAAGDSDDVIEPVGLEVSPRLMTMIAVSDFLTRFASALIAVLLVLALAVASQFESSGSSQ